MRYEIHKISFTPSIRELKLHRNVILSTDDERLIIEEREKLAATKNSGEDFVIVDTVKQIVHDNTWTVRLQDICIVD